MRRRNKSGRRRDNGKRRAIGIRRKKMEASLTNLKSRGAQRHRRWRSIKRRRVKGLGLQRDVDLKARGRKRFMMRYIRTQRSNNLFPQTRTAWLGATIR